MVEKRLRKVLLVDDMMDGGWSTVTNDPEQKLFLLGYKPFIENHELIRRQSISCYVATSPVRPELEYELSDACYDGDWDSPLVVSSTHLLYVHASVPAVRVLVESFVRDWVLRFGRTWEKSQASFPDLRCIGSLRVREFEDDGNGFVVEVDYSSSFASERLLRKTDIVNKREWMKWRE